MPSGRAVPSDQGIYRTCTRHALGKAIVDGFQNRIFDSREIDFDQDKVTDVLIKMDPGQEMAVSYFCDVRFSIYCTYTFIALTWTSTVRLDNCTML